MRAKLSAWFAANARELPWRSTRDPYAILVSEVMLQQTQVDRVLPYYTRFLEKYPTVQELAEAPTAEVIRLWAGLGYNRRAVNLQRAAQVIVAEFAGEFPQTVESLRKLPGIGPYTAGAIAAFAFEQDAAFLDTNMRRVVARVVFGADSGVPESRQLDAASRLVPQGESWTWNQALIEFGALVCTARRPTCVICPLQSNCLAFPFIQTALSDRRRRSTRSPQEPFESTSRYFRGRVVDVLREAAWSDPRGIALEELGSRVRDGFTTADLPWLRSLVAGLQRDGLAVIAEESPPYVAGDDSAGADTRVRLP